jgi:hypothetical protein
MIVMPWGRVGSNLVLAGIQRRARRSYGAEGFDIANEPLNRIKGSDAQMGWLREHYAERDGLFLVGSKQAVRAMTDPTTIAAECRTLDVQLILMHRRNLVKAAVSQMRAEQYAEKTLMETGRAQWGVRPGSDGLGPSAIDPDELLERVEIMDQATHALFDVFGRHPHLSVAYEEILADAHATIDRVSMALELHLAPIELAFQKATSSALRDDVTNFGQIEERLAASRYHEQLLES